MGRKRWREGGRRERERVKEVGWREMGREEGERERNTKT